MSNTNFRPEAKVQWHRLLNPPWVLALIQYKERNGGMGRNGTEVTKEAKKRDLSV